MEERTSSISIKTEVVVLHVFITTFIVAVSPVCQCHLNSIIHAFSQSDTIFKFASTVFREAFVQDTKITIKQITGKTH